VTSGVIRVAHLPARTPYARKLRGPGIAVVNEHGTADGDTVPRDMSFGWLDARCDLGFFDVLHVHSLELADDSVVVRVLDRCLGAGKRVVVTVHDVEAMFGTVDDGYRDLLRQVTGRGIPLVTLTDAAADRIAGLVGTRHKLIVLPHGYVVNPDDPRFGGAGSGAADGVVYAMYGGFRPNRLMYPVCANVMFGTPVRDRLRILTRALSPVELSVASDADQVLGYARHPGDKIDLRLRPFPSDEEIAAFLTESDVLVMPYLWGSHSGQLEMAFDLGLVPVIANTGFFREQWKRAQHESFGGQPASVDRCRVPLGAGG
jgi:hypothetical protein